MTKPLKPFKKMKCFFIIIAALAATSLSVNATEILTFEKIKPDKSCGPRCLNALLQLRDEAKKDCGIKCIYEIIGKEPFSLVNMKELRDAALKLGFTAKAYKLNLDQLKKLKGYYIVPIGKGIGTKENPLHFILVERIQNDYIIFLDNESLETKALSVSEFADLWNGYALVITFGKRMRHVGKKNVSTTIPSKGKEVSDFYEIKDFGHADRGSTLTHTFTIPHEKRKDFQVRIVERSCSCLESELGKDIYGNTTLKVAYKIDGVSWQKAYVAVEIMPTKTIRKYGLVAFGKNSYTVTPRNCFISAPEGGNIEYPFEIQYFTDSEGVVKFDKLKCNNKNISIKNIESYQVQGSGGIIRFNFKFLLLYKAGKPEKRATTITEVLNLIFNTSDGDRTISMDFFAKIGMDKYEVNPSKVFHVASKSDLLPIATRIKCQFFDNPIPDVSLKADGKLPIKYSLTSYEESYYIDMELMKERTLNMPLGLSKENLYLIHQNKNIPEIIIPISLFVKK